MFASRSLSKSERNYAQIDKEALGIVWSVRKFYNYLFARKFTLVTDHQPLTSIFSPSRAIPATTAARLQRYALFFETLPVTSDAIARETRRDRVLSRVYEQVMNGWKEGNHDVLADTHHNT
jgi:alpha-L-fucosidase